MFHGTCGPYSTKACTVSRFNGNLLVRCPLTVYFLVFSSFFCYLRTWSSRIARKHLAASLVKSTGQGCISQHKLLHYLSSSFGLRPQDFFSLQKPTTSHFGFIRLSTIHFHSSEYSERALQMSFMSFLYSQ